MISLVIGLVLGVLIGGAVAYAYQRQQTKKLRDDRYLLAARLRSLVALMDQGLVEVREREVKQMLLDTRALLDDGMPLARPGDRAQVDGVDPHVEAERVRADRAQTDTVRADRVRTDRVQADTVQADRAEPPAWEDEEELPSFFDRGIDVGKRP